MCKNLVKKFININFLMMSLQIKNSIYRMILKCGIRCDRVSRNFGPASMAHMTCLNTFAIWGCNDLALRQHVPWDAKNICHDLLLYIFLPGQEMSAWSFITCWSFITVQYELLFTEDFYQWFDWQISTINFTTARLYKQTGVVNARLEFSRDAWFQILHKNGC